MAVNDPNSIEASLIGRIAKLEDQMKQLSAAPVGKIKFASGWADAVHPIISATPSTLSTTIQVPTLATSCAFSVFASGVGTNTTTNADYLQVRVTVTYGDYSHFTYQSQNNIQPGFTGNVTTPMIDSFTFAPGGGLLTLTAAINNGGSGSWTNTSINAIWPEGMFLFQY